MSLDHSHPALSFQHSAILHPMLTSTPHHTATIYLPFCREAAGLPVLRGVNYAGIRYMKETNVISEEEALALEEGKVVAPLPTVIPQ